MVSSQPAHGHVEGVDVLATSAPGDLRRRTNVGRKAEATDQFRPPRCGLCVMKLCAPGPPSSASRSCQTLPDGVSPNTEGGQTADGRWNPPKDFRHLIGDLLDMSDFAPTGLAGLGSPVEGLTLTPTSKPTRPRRTA